MKFKISKTWLVIIIIVVLIVGYFALKQLFKDPLDAYIIESIDRGNVLQEISETGNVQATDNISLGFKTLGEIETISVFVGQEVRTGQVLASLNAAQLSQQLRNYQAALDVAKAQYQKLIAGNTPEDIKVYEDTRDSAEQDLENAYSSAITTLNDTYTKVYNAFNTVSKIKTDYFSSSDQQGIKVHNSRDNIKDKMDIIKVILDEVKINPSREIVEGAVSNTIKSIEEILSSMKIVRDMTDEGIYYSSVSSTDKSSLDTQKGYIDTALVNITISQQNIASYKLALEKAESNLALRRSDPRQEDIDVYLAQIKQAEANVSLYQVQLNDTYLRSPIDGKITKVNSKPGEVVSASQAVVSLLSSNPFQVRANIYEQDIVNTKIDDPVEVTLIAFPKIPVMGKVVAIDPAEKIVDQVVYYEVTIDFPNEQLEGIKSGMTADIVIQTNKKENVLRVPKNLVVNIDSAETVQILNNGKIEDREILTGLEGNDYYEVLAGLNEGDLIVAGNK